MTDDRYQIVPRGVNVAQVRDLDFQVRIIADYDRSIMRDILRADLFVNGKRMPVHSVAIIDRDKFSPYGNLQGALVDADQLAEEVVREFVGLRWRNRVSALEDEIAALKARQERPRWWQIRRRKEKNHD